MNNLPSSTEKILVTGATGLIGSQAVNTLSSKYPIWALARNISLLSEDISCNYVKCDLLDNAAFSTLANLKPDVVIHCAAMLPTHFDHSAEIGILNSQMDEKIISLCQQLNCRLIYISSAGLYDLSKEICSEKDPITPKGAYLTEKYRAEQSALNLLGKNVVILRINAPYGPKQRLRTVLRIFIENAIENHKIFYDGSGGRQQAFIATHDVAQAIMQAVAQKNIHGIFNIANDSPISMKMLAELTVRTIASKSQILASGKIDPQENQRALFDISKAKKLLDWAPTVSLENGIALWAKYLKDSQ